MVAGLDVVAVVVVVVVDEAVVEVIAAVAVLYDQDLENRAEVTCWRRAKRLEQDKRDRLPQSDRSLILLLEKHFHV